MASLLVTVFIASVLGSLHCAGMCGGFVAFYSGSASGNGCGGCHKGHAAYSVGRLISYSILGAVAGGVGASLDLAGNMAGVQRGAALVAGCLILLWGVFALFPKTLSSSVMVRLRTWLPGRMQVLVAGALARLQQATPATRALAIGLLSTFLPCGWLYAFAFCAAGTGSVLGGVAVMAVFWAGTLPILLGLGYGIQSLSASVRRRVPVISAIALLVVGLLTVFGRVDAIGMEARPAGKPIAKSLEEVTQEVETLGEDEPACCRQP